LHTNSHGIDLLNTGLLTQVVDPVVEAAPKAKKAPKAVAADPVTPPVVEGDTAGQQGAAPVAGSNPEGAAAEGAAEDTQKDTPAEGGN
jgi:hypothetical protein